MGSQLIDAMASSWVELITTTEAAKPPDDVLKEAVRFLTDVAKLQDPNYGEWRRRS